MAMAMVAAMAIAIQQAATSYRISTVSLCRGRCTERTEGENIMSTESTKVIVVNGPNLGRLGVRQPDVYGRQDLEELRRLCTQWGAELGLDVEVRQTDDEAEMVHWMHQAADEKTPVVMNPAAFTHYSYALSDAAHMVGDAGLPLMEVHISNPSARDEFRKRSVISPVATGTITGLGFYGYKLALEAIAHLINN